MDESNFSVVDRVKERYQKATNNTLEDKDAELIVSSMVYFRGIEDVLCEYPDNILRGLFEIETKTRQLVFPCDIIDLRNILQYGYIRSDRAISLYNFGFAKKYFGDYSILLVLDVSKLKSADLELDGIRIYRVGKMEIGQALRSVIVQKFDNGQPAAVRKIMQDLKCSAELNLESFIPGLQNRRFASVGSTNDSSTGAYDGYESHDSVNSRHSEVNTTHLQQSVKPRWRVGDQVQSRHRGIGFNQMNGRVTSVANNVLVVEWDLGGLKKKEQKFDLTRPEQIEIAIQNLRV